MSTMGVASGTIAVALVNVTVVQAVVQAGRVHALAAAFALPAAGMDLHGDALADAVLVHARAERRHSAHVFVTRGKHLVERFAAADHRRRAVVDDLQVCRADRHGIDAHQHLGASRPSRRLTTPLRTLSRSGWASNFSSVVLDSLAMYVIALILLALSIREISCRRLISAPFWASDQWKSIRATRTTSATTASSTGFHLRPSNFIHPNAPAWTNSCRWVLAMCSPMWASSRRWSPSPSGRLSPSGSPELSGTARGFCCPFLRPEWMVARTCRSPSSSVRPHESAAFSS